jgi:hypothetical protein
MFILRAKFVKKSLPDKKTCVNPVRNTVNDRSWLILLDQRLAVDALIVFIIICPRDPNMISSAN